MRRRPMTFRGKVAEANGIQEVELIALVYRTMTGFVAYTTVEVYEQLEVALCNRTSGSVSVNEWFHVPGGLSVPRSGKLEELRSIGIDDEGYVVTVG